MTQLDAAKRRELRDTDFAYVDARGRRRLPIHDASHVRNALARFNQVLFDDEAERDRARTRLLKAARKYGIVPIGFMEGQLRASGPRGLPTGVVTFLMTDIVGSTALIERLGDGYPRVLSDVRRIIRHAVRRHRGREVDARGDEFFAVFKHAPFAASAALAIRSTLTAHHWPDGARVLVRIGLHTGRPTLTDAGYVGLAVHAANRICNEADGSRILLSASTLAALGEELPAGVDPQPIGPRALRGVREPVELFALG